jgi:hypothetical protein
MDEYDWDSWDNSVNDWYDNYYTPTTDEGYYAFDDAVGNTSGTEFGNSGDQNNYNSDFSDWNFNYVTGMPEYVGGVNGNLAGANFGDLAPSGTITSGGGSGGLGGILGSLSGLLGGSGGAAGGTKPSGNILNTISRILGGNGGTTDYTNLLSGLLKGAGAYQQVQSNNANSQQMIDYLNASRQYQSPADFGANPGSLRESATNTYKSAQAALDAFNADPNSNAGNAANKAQISKVLNAQAAMHGNRNNFNYIAPALAAAYADSDIKYQNQYMKDRDSNAQYAGLSNFYKGGETNAMAQALALGNLGNSPYYAAGQNVLSNNSYDSNPDLSAIFKLLQGVTA